MTKIVQYNGNLNVYYYYVNKDDSDVFTFIYSHALYVDRDQRSPNG